MVVPERLGGVNYLLHENIEVKPGRLGGGTAPGQSLEAPY
jgi:hypothetical protein